MRIRDIASFLAFVLMATFALSYLAGLGVRVRPPDDRVNISMDVSDSNNLAVDSNVLLRGVPVGKVTRIISSIHHATIDFYVNREYPIPVDSEVKLENLSALGETYILLKPHTDSGPMLTDGQRVATENVTTPASISELATNVVRVLNQLDPGSLRRVIDEADTALPPTESVLPNLSRASLLLRDTAKSMDGRGTAVLADLQTLLQNAGWLGPRLAELSPDIYAIGKPTNQLMQNFLDVIAMAGTPEAMIRLGAYLNRIKNFLDERSPDLQVIGQALMPNVQSIAGALMNVDTGQMLSNVLNGIPEDGVITLNLRLHNP